MTCYRFSILFGFVAAANFWFGPATPSAAASESPNFQEVYGLIRSNLAGVSGSDLDAAAVRGLLDRFGPEVELVSQDSTASPGPAAAPVAGALARSNVYDQAYGYLRVAQVGPGLADRLGQALGNLGASKKLNGVVLDLRYADGQDYAAAAQTADLFVAEPRLLLDWNNTEWRSTVKTNAFTQPVIVLVNHQTAGAAEALAAVLRQAGAALVLGAPTAGEARLYKMFSLSNGQRLRIATSLVRLGDGRSIPVGGLAPDILVQVNPDDERQYFADAYKVLRRSAVVAGSRAAGTNLVAAATNRAPRLNEADLVRLKREGLDPEVDTLPPSTSTPAPEKPMVADPALARALDLLKGLAVVRSPRAS